MTPLRSITLRAPAKINWTLNVLGRRPDGFHEIDTLLQAVSLYDELNLILAPGTQCRIACNTPGVPCDSRNLVWRAWDAMRREFPGRVSGIRIRLVKRIPSGAGLGGGSSDAAATLVGLNRLFGLRVRKSRLARLAAQIGSDVPFFIHGGFARARGRGEIIQPVTTALPPFSLVIVYPGFASPTAEAYQKLRAPNLGPKPPRATTTQRAMDAARRGNPTGFIQCLANDFDRALACNDPRYATLKRHMQETGLEHIMLSGSGSACFGLAESTTHARKAATILRNRHPASFAVRTLLRRPASPAGTAS